MNPLIYSITFRTSWKRVLNGAERWRERNVLCVSHYGIIWSYQVCRTSTENTGINILLNLINFFLLQYSETKISMVLSCVLLLEHLPSLFLIFLFSAVVQNIKSENNGEILVQNGTKVNTRLFSANDIINAPTQLKFQNKMREKFPLLISPIPVG